MNKHQKEGCLWLSIGALIGFLLIVYMTTRVIALAWRG